MNYLLGFLFGLLAQVLTFLQIQGYVKYQWVKDHMFLVTLIGVPLAWLYMKSSDYFAMAADGALWPGRLIGFGIGIVVFTAMSYGLFKEPMSAKTMISLLLSVAIILIQIFWK